MVEHQIASRGVRSDPVLDAMRTVPRVFVPGRLHEFAYEDAPLPIEEGQTISQPYIVALMIALPGQFDEYVWFDETSAVRPLRTHEVAGVPETYPFGL